MSREPNPAVLFIGGSGRSGSTVLDVLLGQRDGFFSVGELRYIWTRGLTDNRLCGCGVPFRDCEFWNEVLRMAYGSVPSPEETAGITALWRTFERRRNLPAFFLASPSSRFSRDLRRYRELLSSLYQAIASVSGARVIIDSSKHPMHGFVLSRVEGLDLFVAQLLRDPRAVAYSWQRKKLNREIHWKVDYMPVYSAQVSARVWTIANLLTHPLRSRAKKSLSLRYEDLVQKPHHYVSLLAKLVDEPPPPDDFLKLLQERAPVNHTVSGNPSRLASGGLTLRPDIAWKQDFPAGQQWQVSLLTFPLLLAYGYPVFPPK